MKILKKLISICVSMVILSFSLITIKTPSLVAKALSNEEIIYNFLINECGFNKAAACGALANIQVESASTFSPTIVELGYTWSTGGGYGICQWTDTPRTGGIGRRTNLVNWCSKNGYNYQTLEGQLHFLKHELESNVKPGVYDYMHSVDNTAEGAFNAGKHWCMVFEVPGGNLNNVGNSRGNLAKNTYWVKYCGAVSSTPRIENARIAQITNTGYIVQCEVYDDINPVTRVAFPTWTTKTDSSGNEQDDIVWTDGTISGATATFEVKISEHNNEFGYYRTHIYCYNTTGASSSVALPDVCVENTEPSIHNVRIISQTSSSYTIQCDVADNDSGIDRVQFPTWTTANGQDDLKVDWGTNESLRGTIDGNTVIYTVNISDHNDEHDEYETHIYAYDRSGNYSAFGVKVIIEDTSPKISDVKIINQTPTSYIAPPIKPCHNP